MKYWILLLISQSVFADFIPKNLEIYPSLNKNNDLKLQQKYQEQGEKIISIYRDFFHQAQVELKLIFEMQNDKVNAFARRSEHNENEWQVVFTGGLLRHPKLTMNAYNTIFCHELGHHLAGAPYKFYSKWASAEGQSDYFATNDCLYKLNLIEPLSPKNSPKEKSFVKEKCKQIYHKDVKINSCIAVTMAGLDAIRFLQKMKTDRRSRREPKVSIFKRDSNKVVTTNWKHPKSQCRLDTLFEGSLCSSIKNNDGFSENCVDSNIHYEGSRPNCWYAP